MFTEQDKKKCDNGIDKAMKIGEKVGDFIHGNAKGIVRGLVVAGIVVVFGGIFMVITIFKRSFGQKN
jgi:hypothetical protein